MTAATIKKPAKAPATVVAAEPMTLAQATGVAMTELSQALALIASARSTAQPGHYLERTLRMAEEIGLDVMGWMDHDQEDRNTWTDRLYDSQSLLMCAVAYNEGPASTLLAQQAAKLLDKITDDLGQPCQDHPSAVMAAKPVRVELAEEQDPEHMANMALSIVEALSTATADHLMYGLERMTTQLTEEVHDAVRDRTEKSGTSAAVQLDEVMALVSFMHTKQSDRNWNALGAVTHCLKQTQRLLDEMRGDWK
ncbi:hypothetical protein [Pseudorhodoferax sp. Leaf274]|uniref:hypothetical protein n=1 Tax=Pseudorhodoferax sp. Leaf274 TaxID=1736318 RepID=UPI0007036BAE|nr:hypothetical protein [Pseudorhodoferax sp. Leaf274]KQP43947.1 hypothetical protein ASF44_28890 [Pseudorhodoferax sp. Leaf274]